MVSLCLPRPSATADVNRPVYEVSSNWENQFNDLWIFWVEDAHQREANYMIIPAQISIESDFAVYSKSHKHYRKSCHRPHHRKNTGSPVVCHVEVIKTVQVRHLLEERKAAPVSMRTKTRFACNAVLTWAVVLQDV